MCTAQDYNLAISHVILSQIFDTARNAYCILSDQYTDNSSCFLLLVRAGIDQEETESSDLKKRRKKQYVGFLDLVDHENLVTISCFRTFLILFQSYIFNICIYFKSFFSLLVSVHFFSFADINKNVVYYKVKIGNKN